MRNFLEYLSLLASVGGFIAAVAAAVFCWGKASETANPQSGTFAIAGAILTGLLAIAIVIYLKPNNKSEE